MQCSLEVMQRNWNAVQYNWGAMQHNYGAMQRDWRVPQKLATGTRSAENLLLSRQTAKDALDDDWFVGQWLRKDLNKGRVDVIQSY